MRRIALVLFAGVLLLLVGCGMSMGRKFDTSYASQMERGRTTKAEVLRHIGKPVSVSTGSHGETWTYQYTVVQNNPATYIFGSLSPASPKLDMLIIHFEGEFVKDFTLSRSE